MLEKLHDAFRNRCIRYYWDDDLNLLQNIGFEEMRNMEGRLDNVLKNIRRNIKTDPYAIAKWVCEYSSFFMFRIDIFYGQSENYSLLLFY